MIGETISHYRILEKLGEGGMGVVYKAEDTKLKRTVALKFLRAQTIVEEEERTRFLHEAQAAAALNHSNICTIHEINEVEGHTFIAMEFIEGKSLSERARSRPCPLAEALDIAVQTASGLRAAHGKGIVHRDIKSANIMVTPDGQVKITDFGLAKTSGATRVTRTGTTLGTAAYMSPEQALGKSIDQRTDIWSLGVVLYEILMGELPFKGDYDPALMYAIVNEEPEPVTDRKPDVPLEVEQVITRALAKDPGKRYQNANELVEALEELRESLHLLPKRSRLQLRIMRQRRRISWIAALGVIGIIAAVMIDHYVVAPRRELAEQVLEISQNVIAVLPFSVRGGQGTDYLDEAMVDLLSTKLSGVGELRSVDQHALLSYINRLGADPLDVESGRAVAEHFGAGLYILGSVLAAGSNLNISARLYDPASGAEVIAKEVEGKTDELIALVNRLAIELLADRINKNGGSTERLYELSSSFPAIKEYLQGEALYRIGKFGEAVDAFQNAIKEDTLFSLAYLRLGQAASFSPSKGMSVAAQGLNMANELKEHLPERERLLIEAYHTAFIEVNAKDGLPLLRNVVQRYPDYIEGWFWLGDIQFPYGRRHNIGLDEARYSFERTLTLDPDFLPAVILIWWLSAIEEKPEECIAWAKRRLELAPEGEYSLYLRAVLAFVEGDAEEQEKVLEELEIASDKILFWAAGDLATFYGDFDGSKAVWHLIIESSRPPETRAYALTSLAYQELSRGKWIEADECLARAEKLDAFKSVTTRAILSLLPFMQLSNEELEELRNAVAGLDLETKNDTIRCAYVLGLLNARLGNYEAALENASRLEDFWYTYRNRGQVYDWYRWASVTGHNMARCIRGEVARLGGNTEEALTESENILPDLWRDLLPDDIIWSNAYGRFLRATLLEEFGRLDEALRWYGSLGLPEVLEIVYRAPKHRQMGEIYERMGEREKAVRHYSRFVELYADCDEDFRPFIADTEQKLAELRK